MFEKERREFNEWLALRQQHFNEQDISIDDIATLALEYGFSEVVVRPWQASQKFRYPR